MRVKLEAACFWGEGKDRKKYDAGSVIEVPAEAQELNKSWMKPTDDALKFVKPPAEPDEKTKPEGN